ncbi:MAG: IPT/TIG domain-containing protein [Patescibacteria group bacterium]
MKTLISLQFLLFISTSFIAFYTLRHYLKRSYLLLLSLFMLLLIQLTTFSIVSNRFQSNPTITALKSNRGSMWHQITVYGHNFGNAQYNNAQIYLNHQTHRVLLWSDDKIVFVVDALKSDSGDVWVKNVDQKISNKAKFEYVPI